jgi:chromosome segregation ATPase
MKAYFSIASLFLSFLALSLLISLGSCSGPDHSDRIARIDSLQGRLSSYKERLNGLDTVRVLNIQERVDRELELFQKHYERDSMGQELYNALDDQKRTKKAVKGYKGALRKVRKEMNKSSSQLKDLKKDLERGHYSAEKAGEYLKDEAKVIQELSASLERVEKKTRSVLENYESYSSVIKERVTLPDSVSWPGAAE